MREHRYYVYIVASRSHTLYIGFTSGLQKRVQQHKEGAFEGFSNQYNCNRLVYFETHDDVHRAIAREKQLKRWSRVKKIRLVERYNPTWYDLSEDWGKPVDDWDEPASRTDGDAGLSTTALRASGRDDRDGEGCALPVEMTKIGEAARLRSR